MADNEETRTAFLDAVRGNDIVTVGRLLDEHADLLNVRVKPDEVYSATALVVAIKAQHVDMVRYLVERGADTETQSWDGHALLAAACGSDAEILEIFLPEGTDLSELWDNNEDSMLHHACMSGSTAVVQRLLQRHQGPCDWVDLRNAPGRTAFREACRRERTDVMRALLLSGANHTLVDYAGDSPREVAERKKGHKECLALMNWWEKELERGYMVHRARYLYDQYSLLQPQITAAALTAASTLASASIPPFMTPRTSILPLPHLELVGSPKKRGWICSWNDDDDKRKTEEEEAHQREEEAEEEERDAMLKYVIQELKPELYIELLAGFHHTVAEENPRYDYKYDFPPTSSEEDESSEEEDESSEEEEED